VAQFIQVLSLMAVPAAILLTIRYVIVRQNRLADEPRRGRRQPPVRRA
jgi:hypothetical protein